MILYYAIGGGLGHLTRGRRVLELLGLTDRAVFVTASPYAADLRVTGGIPVLQAPQHLEGDRDRANAWLRDVVQHEGVERIIVDVFPGGIQGELCGLDVPMDLVARLLQWSVYRAAVPGPLPRFETTYVLERLTAEHDAFIAEHSARVVGLSLDSLPATGEAAGDDSWLIVHSGPEDEVRELIAWAGELRRDERVLVAARCPAALPKGFEFVDEYPVAHRFACASRIISAAGFNVMAETEAWAEKHHVIPFPRRFDDQYLRAARRRAQRPAR